MKKLLFAITFFVVLSLFQQAAWAVDGGAIYKSKCAACHGAEGQVTAMAPAFKGNAFIGESSLEEISNVIRNGRQGATKKYKNFAIGMPRQSLNHDEIKGIVSYLKDLSGYSKTPVENIITLTELLEKNTLTEFLEKKKREQSQQPQVITLTELLARGGQSSMPTPTPVSTPVDKKHEKEGHEGDKVISSAAAGKLSFKVEVSPVPPDITAAITFSEPSGNNILDAGETGRLTVTVKNSGKGDALDVAVELKPDKNLKGLTFDKQVPLGTLPAGGSVTKEIELVASEEVPSEQISFKIDVKEANGFDADPIKLSFDVKSFDPPKLVVADVGIEDQNRNFRIEPMENIEVTVTVQNIGHGGARGVKVNIEKGENVYIGGEGRTHFDIGSINSGEYKDVVFMFYTNKRIKDSEEIPLSIKITEARPDYKVSKNLALAMNAHQKSVKEFVVKGVETPKGEIELATGLTVDIERDLPRAVKINMDAIAVVIGNSNYRKAKQVDYAVNDAETVKLYLTEVLGFREGNIFFVSNASKGDFELFFGNKGNFKGKLHNAVKAGKSDVFIYYSGHGAPGLKDKRGYFVPIEADPQYIELGGYPIDVFYENIAKLPAKSLTVVLDSCFSGANIFDNISPMVLEINNPVISMENGVVLSSSSGSQVSSWYNEKKHGMFTYFFLKAIHNKNADFDKNNELTFEEIYKYIADNSEGVPYYARRIHGVDQTPTVEGKYHGKVFMNYSP